jgi:hypothetical protein
MPKEMLNQLAADARHSSGLKFTNPARMFLIFTKRAMHKNEQTICHRLVSSRTKVPGERQTKYLPRWSERKRYPNS